MLLQAGISANITLDAGEPALLCAAKQAQLELLQALLEHKALPNSADIAGWTALHVAATSSSNRLLP